MKQAQRFWDESIKEYFEKHKNGTMKDVINFIECDRGRKIRFGNQFGIYTLYKGMDEGRINIKLHITSGNSFRNTIKRLDFLKRKGKRGNFIVYEKKNKR